MPATKFNLVLQRWTEYFVSVCTDICKICQLSKLRMDYEIRNYSELSHLPSNTQIPTKWIILTNVRLLQSICTYLLAIENISKFRFETVFFIYSFLLQTVTFKEDVFSHREIFSRIFQPTSAYQSRQQVQKSKSEAASLRILMLRAGRVFPVI